MVTAIVSLYNPNEKVIDNVCTVASQVDRVILCDNSKESKRELFSCIKNVQYIGFGANLGLSKAFNIVLKDKKYNWKQEDIIVFFDQDSSVSDNYIEQIVDEFVELRHLGYKIGCLGPVFYNSSNGTLEKPKIKSLMKEKTYKVKNIITSSLVTQYKVLNEVNFWNENIFLDFVDWDFCWRIQKAGYGCFITERVILQHSVGSGEKKIGPIKLRIGAPFRVYYQTRDALYLLEEDYVPLKMRIKLISTITVRPVIHYLFLEDKNKRKEYYSKGIKDYKKGLRGELVL